MAADNKNSLSSFMFTDTINDFDRYESDNDDKDKEKFVYATPKNKKTSEKQ